MALPGLKELLPDHLFHDSSRSHLPPLPPILQRLPPLELRLLGYNGISSPSHLSQLPQTPLDPLPSALSPMYSPCSPKFAFDTSQANIDGSAALNDVHGGAFHHEDSPINQDSGSNQDSGDGRSIDEDDDIESINDSKHQTPSQGPPYRRHACPECGKGFNRPSSLRIHVHTHTGAKPFVCPFPGCSRAFSVSSNMRRHYKNHVNRAPMPLPFHTNSNFRGQAWPLQIGRQNQGAFPDEPPLPCSEQVAFPYHSEGGWDLRDRYETTIRGAVAAARAVRKLGSGVLYTIPSHVEADGPSKTQARYEYPCLSTSPTSDSSESRHRSPFNEEHNHRALYSTPPTPPYTNEAALSPPRYAISSVIPSGEQASSSMALPQIGVRGCGHERGVSVCFACWRPDTPWTREYEKTHYVSGQRYHEYPESHFRATSVTPNAERERTTGLEVYTRDVRQQPSPDTPSMYVLPLDSGQLDVLSSGFGSECGEKKGEEANLESEARHEDKYASTNLHSNPRSCLRISALVHPMEETQKPPSSEAPPQSQCSAPHISKGCPSSPPITPLPFVDPTLSAEPTNTSTSDSESTKASSVGTTPGAAPTPPYPLYTLPPSLRSDDEGKEKIKPEMSESSEGGGRRKRRRQE